MPPMKNEQYVFLKSLIIQLCVIAISFISLGQDKGVACEIGDDFAFSADKWEQSADDFIVDHGKNGFRFVDNKRRDIAVCKTYGAVMCFGESVMETRAYFRRKMMNRLEISLFNKGDASINEVQFSIKDLDALIKRVSEKVNGGTKKMPQIVRVRVKNDRRRLGYKFMMKWPNRVPAAELSWGISGEDESKSVEYIRLVFEIKEVKGRDNVSIRAKKTSKQSAGYQSNVKSNEEGDVYIANVPMVDQGSKGYCSVATAERVLRYFGQSIDEHEIAQMAETSAEGGTSTKAMISAVETIGKKCRLGKREIVAKLTDWEDGEKRLKEYNKFAKRLKKPELNIMDYIKTEGNSRTFYIGEMEQAMDAKVLKAMSMRDKSGYGKFIKGIREQTKRGVPLFWSVRLGLYPESGIPQNAGGHMRLIIGYNQEKGEVIYTDSWGAGHERKYMPDDWAWTITHNLFYLNPR